VQPSTPLEPDQVNVLLLLVNEKTLALTGTPKGNELKRAIQSKFPEAVCLKEEGGH
jgi:hypothetical protein